jgi:hypothetical protein
MVNPTIIVPGRARLDQGGYYQGRYYRGSYVQGGYFPAFGHEPGYGRHEIEPPADRKLPPPAQSFHRSWSTHSDPLPADLEPPIQSPLSWRRKSIQEGAAATMARQDGLRTRRP